LDEEGRRWAAGSAANPSASPGPHAPELGRTRAGLAETDLDPMPLDPGPLDLPQT